MLEGRHFPGVGAKVMRNNWSSPPNTWAMVARLTFQHTPTHARSCVVSGNSAMIVSRRRTQASGTSGLFILSATGSSLALPTDGRYFVGSWPQFMSDARWSTRHFERDVDRDVADIADNLDHRLLLGCGRLALSCLLRIVMIRLPETCPLTHPRLC